MINSTRRETGSASREDRAGFAGWSHFYLANPADIVDLAHPVFLYEYIMSRGLSCNFPEYPENVYLTSISMTCK